MRARIPFLACAVLIAGSCGGGDAVEPPAVPEEPPQATCIPSGDERSINSALKTVGSTAVLCRYSVVRDDTIIDATDGGIVVFGAPGSLVANNTIRAERRSLLGGINMVDYLPFDGDYRGTRVDGNVIEAAGRHIKIGLGTGLRVWVCVDPVNPDPRVPDAGNLYGATPSSWAT